MQELSDEEAQGGGRGEEWDACIKYGGQREGKSTSRTKHALDDDGTYIPNR